MSAVRGGREACNFASWVSSAAYAAEMSDSEEATTSSEPVFAVVEAEFCDPVHAHIRNQSDSRSSKEGGTRRTTEGMAQVHKPRNRQIVFPSMLDNSLEDLVVVLTSNSSSRFRSVPLSR